MNCKRIANCILSLSVTFGMLFSNVTVSAGEENEPVDVEEEVLETVQEEESSEETVQEEITEDTEEEISEVTEAEEEQEESDPVSEEVTEPEEEEAPAEEAEEPAEVQASAETEEEEIGSVTFDEGSEEDIPIDEAHFPDAEFRDFVSLSTIDANQDGLLSLTEREAITEIRLFGVGITNLTGIGYFTNLITLNCDRNELTSLDLSMNLALENVSCSETGLTQLNIRNLTQLRNLTCESNSLNSLDVTTNTELGNLSCTSNNLTELDLSNNTMLGLLFCSDNQLRVLDLSNNPEITYLSCCHNGLTELILPKADSIGHLEAYGNNLSSISFEGQLFVIREIMGMRERTEYDGNGFEYRARRYAYFEAESWIQYDIGTELVVAEINEINFPDATFRRLLIEGTNGDNKLTLNEMSTYKRLKLDYERESSPILSVHSKSNKQTNSFNASEEVIETQITSLKGIEYLPELEYLSCQNNDLTELDLSNNPNLTELDCSGNQLTSLDLSANYALETVKCDDNYLTELILDNPNLTYLSCNNNQLSELDLSKEESLAVVLCYVNQLSDLDISNNPELECVACFGNTQMTSLNIDNNPKLISTIENGQVDNITDFQPGVDFTRYWYRIASNLVYEVGVDPHVKVIRLDITEAFPDANFRAVVADLVDTDPEGGDGYLTVGEYAALTAITGLECYEREIASLEGIQYFTSLQSLDCGDNLLTYLDLTANTALENLYCYNNRISSLVGLENLANLQILSCENNQLSYLDVSGNTQLIGLYCGINQITSIGGLNKLSYLEELCCGNNQLTSLVVTSNTSLLYLECNANQLTGLSGLSNASGLNYIICDDNQLTSLGDLSGLAHLESLNCANNMITSLDITNNTEIQFLDCSNNRLTELTGIKNQENLYYLNCSDNRLSSLGDLSRMTYLECLNCDNNRITGLDVTNNVNLTEIHCNNNRFTSLGDLSGLTNLRYLDCSNNALSSLDLQNNTALWEVYCGSNQLTVLDVSNHLDLIWLDCSNNALTDLDVSNTNLGNLYCNGNQLETIDIARTKDYIKAVTEEEYSVKTDSSGRQYHLYQKTVQEEGWDEPYTFELAVDPEVAIVVQIEQPKFKTYSLILSGDINVCFYMDLSSLTEEEKASSYMSFSIEHGQSPLDALFDENNKNSSNYYGFKCPVNSIQMAEQITATFHYGNDQTVEKKYSIMRYFTVFDRNLNLFSDKEITLVHALADFGHYIQPFLADSRNWTLGESYALMDKKYTEIYDIDAVRQAVSSYAVKKTITGTHVDNIKYSLTLDSETAINVYIAPKDYSGAFTATVTDIYGNIVESETSRQQDGRYRVQIPGISAHLLGNTYTVNVKSDGETPEATVEVSALSYVNSILNTAAYQDNDDALNAMSALYYYSQAADAYLAAPLN